MITKKDILKYSVKLHYSVEKIHQFEFNDYYECGGGFITLDESKGKIIISLNVGIFDPMTGEPILSEVFSGKIYSINELDEILKRCKIKIK